MNPCYSGIIQKVLGIRPKDNVIEANYGRHNYSVYDEDHIQRQRKEELRMFTPTTLNIHYSVSLSQFSTHIHWSKQFHENTKRLRDIFLESDAFSMTSEKDIKRSRSIVVCQKYRSLLPSYIKRTNFRQKEVIAVIAFL